MTECELKLTFISTIVRRIEMFSFPIYFFENFAFTLRFKTAGYSKVFGEKESFCKKNLYS